MTKIHTLSGRAHPTLAVLLFGEQANNGTFLQLSWDQFRVNRS